MTYERQNFVNGQVLTAECLNRMESGIKSACDAAPPTCAATDCSKVLSHGENGCEWVDMPSGGSAEGAVLYTEQTLTAKQKAQARQNIGLSELEQPEWGTSGEAIQVSKRVEYSFEDNEKWGFCCDMTTAEYEYMVASADFTCTGKRTEGDELVDVSLTKKDFVFNAEGQKLTTVSLNNYETDFAEISYSYRPIVKIPSEYLDNPDFYFPTLRGTVNLYDVPAGFSVIEGTYTAFWGDINTVNVSHCLVFAEKLDTGYNAVTVFDIENGILRYVETNGDSASTDVLREITGGSGGEGGEDGFSPVVSVSEITGGHSITITDVNGTKTFEVMDGETGPKGDKGDKGDTGPQGPQGEPGKDADDLIPDYVKTEAEEVADKILAVRNADTFVMACASDLHTSGSDTSATGALHAGQAMSEMQSLTELDLVAILGDIQVGDFEENTTGSFKYVKKCFADVAGRVPYLHLQGNHDELPSDTTEAARQRYYAFIGANNVGTVTDYANKFRNYGYRDFDNYKVRVIYLNTADVSEYEMAYDNNITAAQMTWLVDTALDLSVKDDASEWGVIVCGHHPLNWEASGNKSVTKVLDVLDAYKGRTSGSVTVDGQSIAYDFSGETAEFICHIHGHLHNFREEVMGTNKVLSITVPNACFDRNNEYGNYDYATYPEVVERYGDDGANNDGTGTQRIYAKTSGTAKDTAFSVFCIDRASKTINVFNYGAGIDRQWDYLNGVKGEGSEEEPTVTLSSISATYTGGDVAVGTNVTSLTGVTVIATYSDGSTATVTDYTLSGTIALGSNTVTVSYGGLTTTFTVTGISNTPTESYTNQIPLSVASDGSEYVGHNGEDGYSVGYRVNSSGEEAQQSGMCCTGFIKYKGEIVRLKNVTVSGTKTAYFVQYDQNKTYMQVTALDATLTDDGSGVLTGFISNFTGYIRITCGVIDDTSILTLDEEIV